MVLAQIKRGRNKDKMFISKMAKTNLPVRTLVVLGSGGHTTEMLHLLSSIDADDGSDIVYKPLHYIVASSDTTSVNRLNAFQSNQQNNGNAGDKVMKLPLHERIYSIPRAREVGQSYITSAFTTMYSILYTAHIVLFKARPDLLLINGPGTCLPVALWAFVLRVINVMSIFGYGREKGKIVFIESFCRVKSLSLTGKILQTLGIVDLFLVHWPELLEGEKKKKSSHGMILIDSFIKHNED